MTGFAFCVAYGVMVAAQGPGATLIGFATLPADTFADGPPSGAWRRPDHMGVPQFPSQPVQGVSSLWPAGDNHWWALSDNGFGSKANSSDYLLRIYRLHVAWSDGRGGSEVKPESFVTLADPDRRLPFPIVREVTAERWLTGADLDPESLVRVPDGTFWIGDEFGPFLLHFGADGRLLEPPYEIPGMRSPDHPHAQSPDAGQASTATVRRSRGFEGLAHFGNTLYAVIESGMGADATAALIYAFDLASRAFADHASRLPLAGADHAITEFVSLQHVSPACGARFVAIERDAGHGAAAKFKRVHEVYLAGNAAVSAVVADLLDIANPQRLGGHPARFTFPFITTEAVWPLSTTELVLANDNNFPAGEGRPGSARDATEFIRIRLGRAVCSN
jgi:glycerophosphoryl diester phosphodiesterase